MNTIIWRKNSGSGNCVEAGAARWKTASANSNSCVEVAGPQDWHKHSVGNGACVEAAPAGWVKNSQGISNCVEASAAAHPDGPVAVLVRDSKRPEGGVQGYTQDQWDNLTAYGWDSFRAVQAPDTSWPAGKDGQTTLFALDCPTGDGHALYFTEAEVTSFLEGVERGVFDL